MLPPPKMVSIKNPARTRLVCLCLALAGAAFLTACTPPGPRALLRGKDLLDKGSYKEAITELRVAVDLLPTNAIAWQYLGVASQKTGQGTDAERAYQHALALDRDLMEARFNLGCLYLDANRLQEAKEQFTAFNLRRGPSVEGLLKLATAQLRAREATAAERTFSEVLRLQAKHPEALNGLGMARLQRGRAPEAAQFFYSVTREDAAYAPAWLNLAIVRQQHLRDPRGAALAYRQYLALQPQAPNAAEVQSILRQLEPEPVHGTLASSPGASPATAGKTPPPSTSLRAPDTASPQPAVRIESPVQPVLPSRADPSTPLLTPITRQAPVAQTPTPSSRQETPLVEPKPRVAVTPPVRQPAPAQQRADTREEPRNGSPPATVAKAPITSPSASRSTAPASNSQAAPVQKVVLPPETPVRVANDTTRSPTEDLQPNTTPSSLVITTSSVPGVATPKPKRTILQTLNPANLFRGGEKAPERAATSPVVITSTPPAQAASAQKAPGPLTFPRYRYRNPIKPAPGDRASAEKALAQGVQAHSGQKLQAAAQAYRAAAQLDPGFFEAYYNLGLVNAELENLQAALAAYESALAVLPTSPDARYNMALVMRQSGYHQDAAIELQKIIQQYPNDTRARIALGNLQAQVFKQPMKAREQYVKVLEIEPRHPQAEALRSWLVLHPAP